MSEVTMSMDSARVLAGLAPATRRTVDEPSSEQHELDPDDDTSDEGGRAS